MSKLNLDPKLSLEITNFTKALKDIYADNLLSVCLYGSAASGEFIARHSNLNVLILLKEDNLIELKKCSQLIKKFKNITPLFLSDKYVQSSTDIFPIEFLDMQENYSLLYGQDYLKEILIDKKNLRFQCEQELKSKLLSLKHLYLKHALEPGRLEEPLLKSFNSILHILRNVLRLKGLKPAYKKENLLQELVTVFKIKIEHWAKIQAAKLKKVKLSKNEVAELFMTLVNDLEEITQVVDAL